MHQEHIKTVFKHAFSFFAPLSTIVLNVIGYIGYTPGSGLLDRKFPLELLKVYFYSPLHYQVFTSLNRLLASPFGPCVC